MANVPGAASPKAAATYDTLKLDPRTGLRTGEVSPGQSITVPLPVDVSDRARVLVRWKDTPLKVTLRDPKGHLIKSDGETSDKGSEYLELGFADFASYVLTDTVPGDWGLVLKNESSTVAPYVAYATFASPVRLQLRTNLDWYSLGEEVVLG